MGCSRLARSRQHGLRLCIAVIALLGVAAPPASAGASDGGGTLGGSSGVTTTGSRTDNGGTASVDARGGVSGRPTGSSGASSGGSSSGSPSGPSSSGPAVRCTYAPINPVAGRSIDPSTQPEGTRLWRTCVDPSTGRTVSGPTLIITGPTGAATPEADPTPALLASARARLDVPMPTGGFSPPNLTLPNFDTWLSVAGPAELSESAATAGVTVTVAATRTSVTYRINPVEGLPSTDDGVVLTCPSVCRHRFAAPTRALGVSVTTRWRVRWSATNGDGGELGEITQTANVPYRVQAKETVISSAS